jgi:UDP-GlcNAc:undecaprenyl-phosphate/decaprenyl-phosphate GlcNAc-1-phosphate transferase
MIDIFWIALVALVFSTLGAGVMRGMAEQLGFVSSPRERDLHRLPVPLLGGVTIFIAFVIAVLIFAERAFLREFAWILLGAACCSLVGLADDRWRLPAAAKLAGQLVAACFLLGSGAQVQIFPQQWQNIAATLLWVAVITNAINLIDNMDGLSAGVVTVASSFFLLLAVTNEPRQVLVGMMAAALAGACMGFLRLNYFGPMIFMGDAGSLMLGYLLAVIGIKLRFMSSQPAITWMIPVFVLGLPLFDTVLVVISRCRRGVNPFTTAGKDHLSHRLVALGCTPREAVLLCYLAGGVCGLTGVYISHAHVAEAYFLAGATAILGLIALVGLERLAPRGL